MAMARWVLPVPVPPTSTALRCWARNPPSARSRIDRRALEPEVVEILGERQFGNAGREEALAHQPDLVLDLPLLPPRCWRAGNRIDEIMTAYLQEATIVEAIPADK